jgi:peptide-methionine (R)-S-oxide reductase
MKSKEEWRSLLRPEVFHITREAGTEPPWSGEYLREKRRGTFHCICCKLPLFRSDGKFDSGCGWPSFFEPLEEANLKEISDTSHGMKRIEIRCSQCDAHMGHVFPDGPPPKGLRYCINSLSLNFHPEED